MEKTNGQQPEVKYEVRRYFDDHFEKVVGKDLSKDEATELADKLNDQPRAYVNHFVHPQLTK